MDEVERLDGIAPVDDARDVDLVRALADHLNVHVALRERREHASGDADHVPHLLSHHRQDRHVVVHRHLSVPACQQSKSTASREQQREGREKGEGRTHSADFL